MKKHPALGSQMKSKTGCARLVSGGECPNRATWHIIWELGGGASASTSCDSCREYALANYAIIESHSITPACLDFRGYWFRTEHTCRIPRNREDARLGVPSM